MSRPLLVALSAIALLCAASFAAVSWVTSGGPALSNGDGAPGETPLSHGRAAPDAPRPTLAPPDAGPLAQPGDPPATPRPHGDRPRPAAGDRSFQSGVPTVRRRALSSLRRELISGFAELRKRVAPCVRRGREGAGPLPAGAAQAASDASFLLALETVEGGVRILDARLESRGTVTDAEIECARAALSGWIISAPSAQPGNSWEMPFAL